MNDNPYRLPRHAVPHHYDIHLEPDLETLTFTGSVGVDLEVLESTDYLVLNAAELEVKSATISSGPAVAEIAHNAESQRVTLKLAETIQPGEYRLTMEHAGTINDQLRGLYKAVYKDAEGKEHVIATSQCQSTDARRIFPNWDEPDFKATFQTTMVVADGLEAYSNAAEVAREATADGRVKISFAKTMKMSSYLLAFIVGPFEATEPVDVRGTPTRIIVPKGNLHLTDVAMENAIFCFEYLSDYYDIPYPGDKLDHIAIPDFAAGAMENVGLITYRDSYLVINRDKASQAELERSVDVIGHEIAHQWFGNLVTMAWWEGAWLNEAFASFMEMKATDAMHPEWKRWLTFANLEVPWAMATDQLASTRPIEFTVNSPAEVDEMFDAITYGKGCAVLHMIEEFMGVENFRTGVGTYLRKHEYANTVTTDLWEGLDSASDWPIGEIMDTWVFQKGFPRIDAEKVNGGIRLSQRRFLVIPDETDSTIWKVPIQLRGSANGEPFEINILLEDDETMIPVEGDIDWIVTNVGGYGFYRSHYSDELFEALISRAADLDPVERYTLLSDTVAFVKCGQVTADAFLDLVGKFEDESEAAIWSVIIGGLGMLEHHTLDQEAREAFESFVRDLVTPALDRLGWEPSADDSDLDRKLRGDLIVAMGNLGEHQPTIDKARDLVERLLAGDDLDPEVATAALTVYARHGVDEEYATLWKTYQEAVAPLDQVRYLRAVAGVIEEDLALTTLRKVLDGDIRTQDGFWVFARLLLGKAGPAVWRLAAENWDRLVEVMPGMTRHRIAEGISALSQPEVAAGVRSFLAEHPVKEAAQAIAQNLEKLDANVKLRERETPNVTAYFT
ncbi:MAG: M1 family metallopeptidase [Acidimicrobiia bacterium]|nr:M1 family metallopeptidase [Acidimicrobiia bacterium]